ncbi:MAG: TAT-variant-translocated molybdopterin oxidoreductase, partial [Planctomycetota bacterium]
MSDQPSRVYWKSFEERDEDPAFLERAQAEFAKPPLLPENLSLSRRGFLKGFAAVFASTALAACTRGPLKRAIPLLVQPEELVPGRSLWYATNYRGVGVLAKVRDGRPIKLEGNAQHPFGGGGLSAVDQAQLLGL